MTTKSYQFIVQKDVDTWPAISEQKADMWSVFLHYTYDKWNGEEGEYLDLTDGDGSTHEEAITKLEAFVSDAQEALKNLKAGEEHRHYGNEWQGRTSWYGPDLCVNQKGEIKAP